MNRSRRRLLGFASALPLVTATAMASCGSTCRKISVKDFGAIGDGVTDDTPAFRNAILAAQVLVKPLIGGDIGGTQIYYSGVDIYVPAGTYLLTSTLVITSPAIGFTGDGHSQTVLYRIADYGHTIQYTPIPLNAPALEGSSIRDLSFLATNSAPTKGAHISMTACFETVLHNLRILGGYAGIELIACSNVFASNIRMASGFLNWKSLVEGSYFVKISGLPGVKFNPQSSTIFFNNFNFQGGSPTFPFMQYGILIENCDLAQFSNGYCGGVNNADAILSGNSSDDEINDIQFTNVEFDGSAEFGVAVINPNGNSMRSMAFESCNFVNTEIGLYVDLNQTSGDIRVNGSTFRQNSKVGAYIVGGSNIAIEGTTIQENAQNVILGGGAAEDIRIQNNYIGQPTNNNTSGILITGPVSRAIITNNNFRRNSSAMSGFALGSDSIVSNNTVG